MKLKHLQIGLAMAATVLLSACGSANHEATEGESNENNSANMEAMTQEINTEASKVMWKGTMIGVYSHEGTLDFTSGSLSTEGNQITGGTFTINMASMTATDGNYNAEEGKTPEKLVGHLSAPEFFDVANYPTATFVIKNNENGMLVGDLTMKGVTKEEKVENLAFDEASRSWTGTMNVDRKKYGVSWDSPMKEMVLSDAIEIQVKLVL